MTLRILKAERMAQFLADPVWDEVLLRYLLHEAVDKTAFARWVETIIQPELQHTALSIAEQLRHEGLQKGLQEAIIAIHDPAHLRRPHRAAIQSATLEDFARAL